MTLIECFHREPVENIIACLRLEPEEVIFLGDEEIMANSIARYREFLKDRKLSTRVLTENVALDNIPDIVRVLSGVLETRDNCVIDITGGEETVLLAVGSVYADLSEEKRNHVNIQKFPIASAAALDCDADGVVFPGKRVSLSVEELIFLHGGKTHPRTEQPHPHATPAEIAHLWHLMRHDAKHWNKALTVLGEFESRSYLASPVFLPLAPLSGVISEFNEKLALLREFLGTLAEHGLIANSSTESTLHYSYKSPLIAYCMKKAGNILEVKTLLEARQLQVEGKTYFDDCLMSVTIDWDSPEEDSPKKLAETRNEVDLVAVKGMIPLFVSCKNGNIGDDELYKLHTVAQQFGSRNARKLLIATDLSAMPRASRNALEQRAKDMHITLVPNAAKLTSRQWRELFKAALDGCLTPACLSEAISPHT